MLQNQNLSLKQVRERLSELGFSHDDIVRIEYKHWFNNSKEMCWGATIKTLDSGAPPLILFVNAK